MGVPFLDLWFESRQSNALINYGASVSWPYKRVEVMEEFRIQLKELSIEFKARDWRQENFTNRISLPSNYSALPSGKILSMLLNIRLALEEGRLGVAVPIGYLPGASLEEFFRVYQLAGELQVPIITHVRN